MDKAVLVAVGVGLGLVGLILLTRKAEAVPPEEEIPPEEELPPEEEIPPEEEPPPEPPEAELKIELGKMSVFAAEAGDSLYELTFSARITNVGDAPVKLQLIWGTKNYWSPEWEEEASRIITIQAGQTYPWSWTFGELVEDYYKGFFTCILYIQETNQSATGIWT